MLTLNSRTDRSIFKIGLTAIVLSVAMSSASFAFDPEKTFKPDDEPRTILRFGFKALKQGNMSDAIGAFRFGAKKNDIASQWKLARMMQKGEDMPKDDLSAYLLYAKIAGRHADRFPRRVDLPYVSSAFVSLGRYSLTGIEGTNVVADPRRAEDYLYRAAALYKDRTAQYMLGSMYRHGTLGVKQPRSAVRWLGLSARKGHRKAQLELGEMLFYGEGVKRNPVRGLVFMTRAAANSTISGVKFIRKKRKEAFAKASAAQREAANRIFARLNPKAAEGESSFALEQLSPVGEVSKASQSD